MADGEGEMRRREQRNVYATIEADQTDLLVQGTPNTLTIVSATVTLKTKPATGAGSVVGSINDVPVTDFTSTASTKPECWFLLKPEVLSMAPGDYELTFLIVCSNGSTYELVVIVTVLADDDP